MTDGMKNEDDATALLCVFRGQAFREQGFHDAAHEALKEALRSKSRAASIRHLALAERAQNYLAQNKKAMARRRPRAHPGRRLELRGCARTACRAGAVIIRHGVNSLAAFSDSAKDLESFLDGVDSVRARAAEE